MTTTDEPWGSIAAWAGAGMVIAAVAIWIGGRFLNVRLRTVRAMASFVIGSLLGYTLLGIFVVRDAWHWHHETGTARRPGCRAPKMPSLATRRWRSSTRPTTAADDHDDLTFDALAC